MRLIEDAIAMLSILPKGLCLDVAWFWLVNSPFHAHKVLKVLYFYPIPNSHESLFMVSKGSVHPVVTKKVKYEGPCLP